MDYVIAFFANWLDLIAGGLGTMLVYLVLCVIAAAIWLAGSFIWSKIRPPNSPSGTP